MQSVIKSKDFFNKRTLSAFCVHISELCVLTQPRFSSPRKSCIIKRISWVRTDRLGLSMSMFLSISVSMSVLMSMSILTYLN